MAKPWKICPQCGKAHPGKHYVCDDCKPAPKRKPWPTRPEHHTPEWRKLTAERRKAYPICERCGVNPSTSTDHIVPVSLGGTNDWSNLAALCDWCHKSKSLAEAKAALKAKAARRLMRPHGGSPWLGSGTW